MLQTIVLTAGLSLLMVFQLGGLLPALYSPASTSLAISEIRANKIQSAQDSALVTLTITNKGEPDRLVNVTSQGAQETILVSPNVMGLAIPGNSTVKLDKNAGHIILSKIYGPIYYGKTVPLVLEFDKKGLVDITAKISPTPVKYAEEMNREAPKPAPTLRLDITALGDNRLRIKLRTTNFVFAKKNSDNKNVAAGYGQIVVDGVKLEPLFGTTVITGALPPGHHVIEAYLKSLDAYAYTISNKPIHDSVIVRSP